MSDLDEKNWAAARYRVDRESTGVKASKRKLRKIGAEAVKHGDPVPEPPRDIIRIYDREGNAVFERDWGENRSAALDQEATIVDDLLHLDVLSFQARYSIPIDEAPAVDPWAGLPPPRPEPPDGPAADLPEGPSDGA